MRKVVLIAIVLILAIAVVPAAADGNGTQVTKFGPWPWNYFQCVPLGDHFGEIPAYFGEDVCVDYDGLTSETVRVSKNSDVSWTASIHGTATIYADPGGNVLAVGQFKMDEVGRDLDGDANCLQSGGWVMAEADPCPDSWETTLDFLEHHWKVEVDGETIFFYNVAIHGAGNWCISSKDAYVGSSTNCPPGVSTED